MGSAGEVHKHALEVMGQVEWVAQMDGAGPRGWDICISCSRALMERRTAHETLEDHLWGILHVQAGGLNLCRLNPPCRGHGSGVEIQEPCSASKVSHQVPAI